MLISETVILTEENRKSPPLSAKIRRAGGFYKITIPKSNGKIYAINNEGIIFKLDGEQPFSLPLQDDDSFYIAVVNDSNYYFGSIGKAIITRADIKRLINSENSTKVNDSYDDFAIAVENYYPQKPSIHPRYSEITCDKGHLLNNDSKYHGQDSTIYPQCGFLEKGEHYDKKSSVLQFDNDAEKTPHSVNKETPGDDLRECNESGICPHGRETFYDKISASMRSLLCSFPRESTLEQRIPSSTFVKINYSENKFYVAGLTEPDGQPEYVVFGVPLPFHDIPKELDNKGYFLPSPKFDDKSGYYLLFQDALTGELLPPFKG